MGAIECSLSTTHVGDLVYLWIGVRVKGCTSLIWGEVNIPSERTGDGYIKLQSKFPFRDLWSTVRGQAH